jgi:xanthine dehydrogenase accessory factor
MLSHLIAELCPKQQPFAVATVIETGGSVPAKTAPRAVIDAKGNMAGGWVGGDCAEGAVCKAGLDWLTTAQTAVLDLDLDDEVLGIGMRGTMRVYVDLVLQTMRAEAEPQGQPLKRTLS